MTARRYKDVVLCGHSMGGAITLLYALKYPDELRGIVLMGTGARLKVHPDYLQRCKEPGEGNKGWLEWEMGYYQAVEPDIQQVLQMRATEIGPEVDLNDYLACDKFDVMDQVHKIKLPTQVLCGGLDTMTPVKYADYLAGNIQGAREQIIPGAHHYVQLEKYQQVNEQIEVFVASLK